MSWLTESFQDWKNRREITMDEIEIKLLLLIHPTQYFGEIGLEFNKRLDLYWEEKRRLDNKLLDLKERALIKKEVIQSSQKNG
jgi:hypothetical protein